MSLTVRENISAWVQTRLDLIAGATAIRPKRINWSAELTADQTVIIQQRDVRTIHQDDTDLVIEQDYAIIAVVIDSDDVTTSIDYRINILVAAVLEALFADRDCGGYAMAEGLRIVSDSRLDDSEGQISGRIIQVCVTYSVKIADFTQKGVA